MKFHFTECARQNGKIIIALWRAYQYAHKKSISLFRENGITMAQFMALEVLYNKGELSVQEIVSKVLSSSGNITVVIRNLERDGLIVRRLNPVDGRSYLISLSKKGKKLMDKVFPLHMKNLGDVFEVLTGDEKDMIISLLKKLSSRASIEKKMKKSSK